MYIHECEEGMKVICISDGIRGAGNNPPIKRGSILTISQLQHYPTSDDGINFKEIPHLWYPQDFEPIKNNVRKL